MSLPPTGQPGLIDLDDWNTRLHFANRALHILQLHSDPHGFLSISSSDRLLRSGLAPLTVSQVREVNQMMFDLGLRKTKSGGGEHIIRKDITHITIEQLQRGRPIPVEKEEAVTEETLVNVSLALEALRENAERINHPRLTLGVVRNHMQIIEELCGERAGEVIMHLKALALYRMHSFGDEFVCFVNETEPAMLRERDLRDGKPLIEWPDTLEGLLPPSLLVQTMPVEEIIASLARACDLAEDKARKLGVALTQRTEELRQVAEAFERLEQERNELAEKNAGLSKENERLTAEISDLHGQLRELRSKPAAAELDPGLTSRVTDILGRYGPKRPGAGG